MSVRSLLAVLVLLVGCNTQQNTFHTFSTSEAGVTTNSSVPISAELFALSVKPQLLMRDTRARITLDVEKEITGKLLLIDLQGNILENFHEGQFETKRYAFTYSVPENLPLGRYLVILADEENNVIDNREITLTDSVMDKLK